MASLVAVFMALGVGIIIGSLLVGENMADDLIGQQEKIVQRLEREYQNLKDEVRMDREDLAKLQEITEIYKSYALEFLPQVIKGRLAGERIAVIFPCNAPSPDLFLDNLRVAEAQVVAILTFEETLYRLQEGQAAELSAFLAENGGPAQARSEYVQQLARVFAGEDSTYNTTLGELKMSMSQGNPGPVHTVVIINTYWPQDIKRVVDDTVTLLARSLREKGIKTYEAGLDYSISNGVHPTIDNIPGQVALINAIAEDKPLRAGN